MTLLTEIAWLAGLLEGEGSFTLRRTGKGKYNTPAIDISLTDKDVLTRAAHLLGTQPSRAYKFKNSKEHHKPHYACRLAGRRAVGWMMTLFSFLGERRRQRIMGVVVEWRDKGRHPYRPQEVYCAK